MDARIELRKALARAKQRSRHCSISLEGLLDLWDRLWLAEPSKQGLFMPARCMEDRYQVVVGDHHFTATHVFKTLDLLLASADLPFHVFVAQQIDFGLAVRDKDAVTTDHLDIDYAKTALIGAPLPMLRISY